MIIKSNLLLNNCNYSVHISIYVPTFDAKILLYI